MHTTIKRSKIEKFLEENKDYSLYRSCPEKLKLYKTFSKTETDFTSVYLIPTQKEQVSLVDIIKLGSERMIYRVV